MYIKTIHCLKQSEDQMYIETVQRLKQSENQMHIKHQIHIKKYTASSKVRTKCTLIDKNRTPSQTK